MDALTTYLLVRDADGCISSPMAALFMTLLTYLLIGLVVLLITRMVSDDFEFDIKSKAKLRDTLGILLFYPIYGPYKLYQYYNSLPD